MIELVRRVADTEPQRVAVVDHAAEHTYGQLAARATAATSALRAAGITRAALLEVDAAAVIALLCAASAAGVELCQYPPTAEPAEIADLAARLDHDLLLTTRPDLVADPPPGVRIMAPSELLDGSRADDDQPLPEARPHLVLTTGTTGAPRGVRHDWWRLLRGTTRIAPTPGQRWLLAYGLHQFAGLQIMLHVLAAGATLVAPAPRRPIEGLAALRTLGATHASATPTYWRFLLAALRSDGGPVPRLTQITLGGEAIPGPLLEHLRATFPDARISQVYAASEFGSSGSMRDGRSGLSTAVLERGDDADVAMRVVDGELWVRSRTGMLGYYGEPPVDADGWRATGDLVDVEGDRIVFRGRTSDVINVGGVKVHPLPIEERVATVPDVDVARVFGRPNAMTGAIVAVELVLAAGADPDAAKAAVRAACADLPAASQPRSIKVVESLTTAGDKIVRTR